MILGLALFATPLLLYLGLLYRISAFRRDRQGDRRYFAPPLESMTEVLTKSNYTEQGQRLLPWLVASIVLLVIGAFGGLWAITRSL